MSDHLTELPRELLTRWRANDLGADDLKGDLPTAWLYNDEPTALIAPEDWLELFDAAGFISMSWGTGVKYDRPTGPKTLYRGATLSRARGMSWCYSLHTASKFRDGVMRRSGESALIYRATVPSQGIKAILFRPGDGGIEFVVNPDLLGAVTPVGDGAPEVSDEFFAS